jgi:YD repeat-containing protein
MYGYTQAGQVSGKRLQILEANPGFGTMTRNLDASYAYNNEGKVTSVSYPATDAGPGPVYNYTYDSMGRLAGMTDQSNTTDVTGVTYSAANDLLTISYFGATESRVYNNLRQLTQLTSTGATTVSYTYNYPAGANNGKISSQVVSGETITYQYDSLNRMIAATSSAAWGESFGYDSFGNLLSKTVTQDTGPTLSQAVNPANNQIVGQTYDANGNELSAPAGGHSDV